MATSHDNFFVTTLIDRAERNSGRVRDMVNGTKASRVEFDTDLQTTAGLGKARIYAWTGGDLDITLTLSTETLLLGTPTNPYVISIKSEGGIVNQTLTVDTEGGENIDGDTTTTLSGGGGYSYENLYSNGTQWFSK